MLRLAAKEGQPETVAAEYRKVAQEIQQVMRKVVSEVDKLVDAQLHGEVKKK